jgi:ABC-2 type transport system ATP-binding protein
MARSEELVIEARNVYKYYRRKIQALNDISLTIKKGEHVVIVGPNGSGKSTLIKLIMGLTRPDKGYINVFGAPVGSKKYDLLRRRIGYMPEKTVFPPGLSVEDYLYITSSLKGCSSYTEEAEVLGLHKFYNRGVSELSQGYKRRLLLAVALTCRPEFLVLDEPYANVDVETRLAIDETLGKLTSNVTVLIASHTKPCLEKFRLILLMSGRILGELLYYGDYVELVLSCDSNTYKFNVTSSKSSYKEILAKVNELTAAGCKLQDINMMTFDEMLREIFRRHYNA